MHQKKTQYIKQFMKTIKTHNKALQLATKSSALLAFGSTELSR